MYDPRIFDTIRMESDNTRTFLGDSDTYAFEDGVGTDHSMYGSWDGPEF